MIEDEPEASGSLPDEQDASPPRVEGGVIRGLVTDFDGNALVGVRVETTTTGGADLDLLPAMTDGDGRFVLEGLAVGAYDLRFVLGQVRARTLAVPTGTEDLRVRLARPQGILLVVRTLEDEDPPEVLHVVLERHTKRGAVVEHSGRHMTMRMLLWSIRPGRYSVTVWGGAYLPVHAHEVDVREGRPAPKVEVVLSAQGGRIRGRVLDERGAPPACTLVAWRRLDAPGPWPRHECTPLLDEEGWFEAAGLPEGRYLVSAGRDCGPFVDQEVDVSEERTTEVEIRVP